MYVNSPDLNQTDDDDLFTRPPRSSRRQAAPPIERTARRTCRACDLTYVVALDYDGPPLCDDCRADVEATRARLRKLLDGVLGQMDIELDRWDSTRSSYPDLWAKLDTALTQLATGAMTEAELSARWKARYYDPNPAWRILLKAYEDRECALAALGAERARLERALEACEG